MTSTTETTTASQPAVSAPERARAEGRNPLDYLRERGFVQDVTDEDGLKRAFASGSVTVYWGVDPTATSLHVGNMVSIMLLASLQRFGHRPIALGGGGTALVGDPTGRTSSRELISPDDLERNLAGILPQLRRYLDFEGGRFGDNPKAELLNNADWLLELRYIPFLRDIGRHFSVNEMLAAETYRTRLESTGLNFVEFNYRIVQAYDFLHLYRTHGCSLQVGGSDQWGNITAGVELIRKADGGKVYALVTPLITTATGEKMGKTSSGARAWLDPALTSPFDYYQYWVNTDDRLVGTYLRLFTFLPEEAIAALTSVSGEALREAKQLLAFEATTLAHGRQAALEALAGSSYFIKYMTTTLSDMPTEQVEKILSSQAQSGAEKMAAGAAHQLNDRAPAQQKARKEKARKASQGGAAASRSIPDFSPQQTLDWNRQIASAASIDAASLSQITDLLANAARQPNHQVDWSLIVPRLNLEPLLPKLDLRDMFPELSRRQFARELIEDVTMGLSQQLVNVGGISRTLPQTEIPRGEIDAGLTLADAFVRAGLAKSRNETRRLAQQGGLSVDGIRVTDVEVPFRDVIGNEKAVMLRVGRKRSKWVLVI